MERAEARCLDHQVARLQLDVDCCFFSSAYPRRQKSNASHVQNVTDEDN